MARSKDAYGTRAPKGLVLWVKHWAKASAADLMVWPTHRTAVEHIGKQDKQAEHQTCDEQRKCIKASFDQVVLKKKSKNKNKKAEFTVISSLW